MSKGNPGEIALKIRDHVDRGMVPSTIYETEACIFRVPKLMREAKEDAYTPKVVSIGPYHRMDERLHPMEHFKLQYLGHFLDLSTGGVGESSHGSPIGDEVESIPSISTRFEGESIPDLSMDLKEKSKLLLESCVKKILEKEDQIRGSYSEHISLSGDDFVQMVLLDTVFIILSLGTLSITDPSVDDIPRLQHRVIKSAFDRVKLAEGEITRDLLLLENQLPLFIIDEIYNIRYPSIQGMTNTTLGDIVAKFLDTKLPPNWLSFRNLLALIRNDFVGNFQIEEQENMGIMVAPTASRLHASGVKFKAVYHAYIDSIMGIQFDEKEAVLSIPTMSCEPETQSMFRNVIAMEQCMYLYKEPTYIKDYFNFMDSLIDSEEDVELLADQGIIPRWYSSGHIRDMFNTMTDGTRTSSWNYSYSGVSDVLNDRCDKKWNRYKATLKNKYFSGPWTIISVVTAIVLLLLTIAQVILGSLALPGVL